ncbi:MAG: hypothetical protein R3F14_44075 [Polyangiaceae bacterium]
MARPPATDISSCSSAAKRCPHACSGSGDSFANRAAPSARASRSGSARKNARAAADICGPSTR